MTTTWNELIDKYGELDSEISIDREEDFFEIKYQGKLKDCNIDFGALHFDGDDYYMYSVTDYELHENTIYISLEEIY